MLKIGEFSILSRVSVKALRHYDEIGLLKPAHVSPSTNYRFYGLDQLPRLYRILALRDLGFSLEHVGEMVDEGVSPQQIRGMLRLRLAELQSEVMEGRERLARVEARLRQIEQEGKMPDYDVGIKNVEPQLVASVRDRLESYGDVGRLFGELYGYLGPMGAAGLGGALWHDAEYKETDIDCEAISILSRPVPEGGRVKVHDLPAVTAASTVHRGAYRTIDQAYAALFGWVGANGYKAVGPSREIYLKGGSDRDDESYVTEIQLPVAKD